MKMQVFKATILKPIAPAAITGESKCEILQPYSLWFYGVSKPIEVDGQKMDIYPTVLKALTNTHFFVS